jgi:hypothetical protein
MLGFASWVVLAYYLSTLGVRPSEFVPVLYAAAMGAAVAFGRIYDRAGLRGLVVLPS